MNNHDLDFDRVAPLPDIYRGWRDQLKFYEQLADRMPDQRRIMETEYGFESGPRDLIDYAIRDAREAAEAEDMDGFALHLQQAVELLIHSEFGTVAELALKKNAGKGGANKRGHEGPLKQIIRRLMDDTGTDDPARIMARWRELVDFEIENAETISLSFRDGDDKPYWAEWLEAENIKAWSERAIKDAIREIRQ